MRLQVLSKGNRLQASTLSRSYYGISARAPVESSLDIKLIQAASSAAHGAASEVIFGLQYVSQIIAKVVITAMTSDV